MMDERVLIVIGIVMVVIGIACAVHAGPMEMQATATYAGGDLDSGASMRIKADTYRYGGLGFAALGVVLMTGSWVKFVIESSKRI